MSPVRKPRTLDRDVELRWATERDQRRLRRVAEILQDILDNASTPGEGRRS